MSASRQAGDVGRLPGRGGDESDQTIRPVFLAKDDRGLADARTGGQPRLDLTQFHPVSADFHLVVDTAVKDDISLGIHAHRVAER